MMNHNFIFIKDEKVPIKNKHHLSKNSQLIDNKDYAARGDSHSCISPPWL